MWYVYTSNTLQFIYFIYYNTVREVQIMIKSEGKKKKQTVSDIYLTAANTIYTVSQKTMCQLILFYVGQM